MRAATAWALLRPGFLIITPVGALLGFAIAVHEGTAWTPLTALFALLLATMLHAAGNVINDLHDTLGGHDAANTGAIAPFTGGSRLLVEGAASVRETRALIIVLLLCVLAGGIGLLVSGHARLAWIGLAGIALAWSYSAPPFAWMKRGLGEVVIGLAWMLVVVGGDVLLRNAFAATPWWLGLGYGLMVANILLINGFPDAASDAATGKRTLVVRAGPQRSARIYTAWMLFAQLPPLWLTCSRHEPTFLVSLLALPLSLFAAAQLRRHATQPARLRPAIIATILAAVTYGVALAATLAFVR